MSYQLYIKDSGQLLGSISDEQLDELIELLEEEDSADHDYYIDKDVLAFLKEEGTDETILALLSPHVTDEDGVEIEWRQEVAG